MTANPLHPQPTIPRADLSVHNVLRRVRLTWPGLDVVGRLLSLTAQPGDTISGRPVRVDIELQPDTGAPIALTVPEHATVEVLS